MKRLVEQYGSVVLSMLLAFVVMGSFFSVSLWGQAGVPVVLGTVLKETITKEELQVKTGGAFDAYKSVCGPVIQVKDSYVFQAGKSISVSESIEAFDGNGSPLQVSLQRVWKDGLEGDSQVVGNNQIWLETGEYWIEVNATDEKGYVRNVLINIFVNER